MKLHINWLNLFRATPLLGKEGELVTVQALTTCETWMINENFVLN